MLKMNHLVEEDNHLDEKYLFWTTSKVLTSFATSTIFHCVRKLIEFWLEVLKHQFKLELILLGTTQKC